MTELPPPMTPADCNLQDFKFMPLDVSRLRGSELASDETPEACWAAVLLWCASWHEIPAASIPDNRQWQAKACGYVARGKVAREWADVEAGALRNWIKCSDGRLYHPVVAEKAIDAWNSKLDQRWRSEMARIKKHNERHEMTLPRPSFEDWVSQGCPQGQRLPVAGDTTAPKSGQLQLVPGDNDSKEQGEGQGQKQGQGDSSSVAGATGAKPPKAPKTPEELAKAELWRAAVSLLGGQGMPEPQARTLMGKLVKDYPNGDIVLDAVREAVKEQPADARAFLVAACQRLSGQRNTTKTTVRDSRASTLAGLTGESTPGATHDTIDVQARRID